MNEQRRQILEMLAEGKLTADEAERLIAALERNGDKASPPDDARKPRPKYLRVIVEEHKPGGGPARVNIRVPIQLLRAGVRLASLMPPGALDRANEHLTRAGVSVDLSQLKPEHIEELIEQLDDMTIEVEEHGAKVLVFCE